MKIELVGGRIWAIAGCALVLLACSALGSAVATTPAAPAMSTLSAPTSIVQAPPVDASPTSAVAPAVAKTLAAALPTATATLTVVVSPVSVLKGSVLQRSNCRYGPGAFFLSKIGMLAGAPIEIIGRDIDGGWAYIQFAGTHNLCWINSKLIQVDGDLKSLQDYYPDKAPLPRTSKFGGASITSVSGSSASITVEWAPVVLSTIAMPSGAGETEYVIEVWTCINGAPGYTTLGTNDTTLSFPVDDSCGMTLHANLVTQTNLGISGIATIKLP
jgi:hypothetical protein